MNPAGQSRPEVEIAPQRLRELVEDVLARTIEASILLNSHDDRTGQLAAIGLAVEAIVDFLRAFPEVLAYRPSEPFEVLLAALLQLGDGEVPNLFQPVAPRRAGRPPSSSNTHAFQAMVAMLMQNLMDVGFSRAQASARVSRELWEVGVDVAPSSIGRWRETTSGVPDDKTEGLTHFVRRLCGTVAPMDRNMALAHMRMVIRHPVVALVLRPKT